MMKRHVWWTSLLIGAGTTPAAWAQPPVPAPPAAAGVAVAAAPAGSPMTLWSFLGCTPEAKEACRRHLCTLQCGQMLNNATAPLGAITGGMIPSLCPTTPTARELAEQGAVGAAAKIKADEAAAKERRAAVRYLGTVDCHYWPEAQDALIAALRTDRNECVRYEAALAFLNGCCCTKAVIEALTVVISCSDRDGFPKETSARVHGAARMALERCLSCYQEPPKPVVPPPIIENPEQRKVDPNVNPEQPPRGDNKKADLPTKIAAERPVGTAYYAIITKQPLDAIVRESRRTLLTTQSTVIPGASGMTLTKLIEQNTGGSEIRGYIVHDGKPGANVVVNDRPKNLWDMIVNNGKPAMVTSTPAPMTMETAVRLTPQASSAPVMQANVPPVMTPMQPAAAAGMTMAPARPENRMPVQAAPPVMKTEPRTLPVTPVVTTPTPAPSAPASAAPRASTERQPIQEQRLVVTPNTRTDAKPSIEQTAKVDTKPIVEQRLVVTATTRTEARPSIEQTVKVESKPTVEQRLVVESKPAAEHKPIAAIKPVLAPKPALEQKLVVEHKAAPEMKPVVKPAQETALVTVKSTIEPKPIAKPGQDTALVTVKPVTELKPSAKPTQETPPAPAKATPMSDPERVTALNAIALRHATPDMGRKLLLLAQMDKSDEVRCAAIRAAVRTHVAPDVAIPVLAELGMNVDTTVGKCANDALAQINLRSAGASK